MHPVDSMYDCINIVDISIIKFKQNVHKTDKLIVFIQYIIRMDVMPQSICAEIICRIQHIFPSQRQRKNHTCNPLNIALLPTRLLLLLCVFRIPKMYDISRRFIRAFIPVPAHWPIVIINMRDAIQFLHSSTHITPSRPAHAKPYRFDHLDRHKCGTHKRS